MNREDDALEDEIARLRGLDLAGLQARWRSVFGRRAPAHLPKHLLVRIICYRLQAEVHGDLDPASIRYLERLAKARSDKSAPLPKASSVRPGTLLVREWDGVVHRVIVVDEGFAWNGASYKSLSQVARAITGTRWNGPRFFGLREGSPRRAMAGACAAPSTPGSRPSMGWSRTSTPSTRSARRPRPLSRARPTRAGP